MKRSSKFTLGSISLSVVTAIAFVAVTTGSLAWYAYSRTVSVSYVGTSVAKSVLLGVGIVDDSRWLSDEKLTDYKLERKNVDGHSIAFTQSTNGLDYHAIQDYLFWSPYASNMLFPLTTQSRAINSTDPLSLYKSPDYGDAIISGAAKTSDYVVIPFAFHLEVKAGSPLAADVPVWLSDVTIQASGQNIDRAVRLYFDDGESNGFLMRPSDKGASTGYTKVGGLLDLDGDGTYDYDKSNGNEFYYGEYTGTKTNETTKYGDKPGYDPDDVPYDNVNDVTAAEQSDSTFYAKHNAEAYLVNAHELTPKQAHYETFGTVKPLVDSSGNYYAGATGKPVTYIDKTTGLGYVTLTIFIEGWDHSVIDKSAGYSFNLGLKFEINRYQ